MDEMKCIKCRVVLSPTKLRLTNRGYYYDGPSLCGDCKAERDETHELLYKKLPDHYQEQEIGR